MVVAGENDGPELGLPPRSTIGVAWPCVRFVSEIERFPEEISDVLRALPRAAMLHTAAVELTDETVPSATSSESAESKSSVVTTRFARRALTRLRLSPPMRKVLTALYEAHPG